jgi:hypothetical protein
MLLTTYKIVSNIFVLSLTPYVDENIGDHQRGFRCNRSSSDHIYIGLY